MVSSGLIWECTCGHLEHQELEPEECLKCGNVGSFIQMPKELIEEREKEFVEEELLSPKKSLKVKVKPKARRKK